MDTTLKRQVKAMQEQDYSSQNLLELRTNAGFSRREFLERLEGNGVKMHTTTLRRIEDGEQNLKVHEALAVAQVFGITLDALVSTPVNVADSIVRTRYKNYDESYLRMVSEMQNFRDAHLELDAVISSPNCPGSNQSKAVRDAEMALARFTRQFQQVTDYLSEHMGSERLEKMDKAARARANSDLEALTDDSR